MQTTSTTQVTEQDNRITFSLDVTIGGETRTVEFVAYRHATHITSAQSDYIAAGRIGRGAKAWRVALLAWEKDGTWTYRGQCTNANNRQTQLIGWASQFEGQAGGSKHVGCYGIA